MALSQQFFSLASSLRALQLSQSLGALLGLGLTAFLFVLNLLLPLARLRLTPTTLLGQERLLLGALLACQNVLALPTLRQIRVGALDLVLRQVAQTTLALHRRQVQLLRLF